MIWILLNYGGLTCDFGLCNLIVQEKLPNLWLYFPVNLLKEMYNPYTFIKTVHTCLEEKESSLRPVKVNEVCFELDGDSTRHGRRRMCGRRG